MYICKQCFINHLIQNEAIVDSERLPRYFCTAMFNSKCSRCGKKTNVDYISEKELGRIVDHEGTRKSHKSKD